MGVETLLTNAGARRTLRRLELEAYASVVSAFRAQGPFTWEKKESLELLCKHLGISRERHRAEIRRAVNDELLTSVAGCISGTDTENAWRKEGQKLTSMNPRFVARQVTHLPQVLASATVNAALGTNVVKTEPEIKKGTSVQVQNALKFIISQNPMTAPKPSPQSQLANKPKATQVADKDTATITVTTATGSSTTATVATSSSKPVLSPAKSLIPSTPPSTPKAAATQTVSAGVQTISSSASTQTPSSTTDVEKSLSVDQETQTSDKRGQESKLSQLNTPDNPTTEAIKLPSPSIQGATLDVSASKPAGSEDHSSGKVPLMGHEEVPETEPDQSSAGQETSVGRPDQQKPLQSSVEEGKHEAEGTEATPDTKHELMKPPVDSKHSESLLIKSSLDLPSATLPVQVSTTLPVQVSGAATPVKDIDTSTVAPPPPPPPVVSSDNAPKPTPLLVVATTIIPASKPVGVTATNTSALTSPLSVVGDSNVPITETQSRENRKRPLTPTSLPPPAKKPAPPPLVTPTLTLTSGTPHVPIPALTPISVHTDATSINPTSTNIKSSTDFSHKQRYPPPPLVHASTVTLPDITTRLKRRSASPSTGLERPHGEVQLRTLLQGAPIVTTSETLPLPGSLQSLPAVSQRSSSPTPPPPPPTMASPLPPRLTSPPPLTLPPTPSTTPTPAPSNTDAFIQAFCSDPSSLEDSTVSALATQLGLDFTDLGLLTGTDILQQLLIQPIGTEPVSAGSSADVMMETQLPSTQPPSTQLPSTQLPSTQLPSTQLPSTQLPSTQLPSTQLPPINIPQPVAGTSDSSLPGLSAGVGQTEATAASPGATPGGMPSMLMTPTPQDHVGMLGELCLQPSEGGNPVFPDLSSLSSSTIESELLEGIPQELAETIQALARLDEQNTAYSPIQ